MADITPANIGGVEDMGRLPFGEKDEYRKAQEQNPPYGGLLCRSESEKLQPGGFIWETSGTTGDPLRFVCTQSEYERVDVQATTRILWIAGVRPGDTITMCWPLTLWAVGHGIVDATRNLNATILPLGPSYSSEFRIRKMQDYNPSILMTTPTYALRSTEIAVDEGIARENIGIERVVVSGEPLTEETRDEIASRWGAQHVFNYYGLSEALNCRSIECAEHDGIHLLEDLYLGQVVEPDGTDPVDPGERGELVVTALEQRDIATGFHFRTGDIARYYDEECACGRTTRRIEIISRKDDMRTIKGVNVYLQAIESVVRDVNGINDEFRLVHEKQGALDDLLIRVEPRSDGSKDKTELRSELVNRIRQALGGLSVEVEFCDPGQLSRFDFKADRWTDGPTQ